MQRIQHPLGIRQRKGAHYPQIGDARIATDVAGPIAAQFGNEVFQALVVGQQYAVGPRLAGDLSGLRRANEIAAEGGLLSRGDCLRLAEAGRLYFNRPGKDVELGQPLVLPDRKASVLVCSQMAFSRTQQQGPLFERRIEQQLAAIQR